MVYTIYVLPHGVQSNGFLILLFVRRCNFRSMKLYTHSADAVYVKISCGVVYPPTSHLVDSISMVIATAHYFVSFSLLTNRSCKWGPIIHIRSASLSSRHWGARHDDANQVIHGFGC